LRHLIPTEVSFFLFVGTAAFRKDLFNHSRAAGSGLAFLDEIVAVHPNQNQNITLYLSAK
jgi:hypothetical protein